MTRTDTRFKIDTLIKLARTTDDRKKREEWVLQAKTMLDELQSSKDSEVEGVTLFLEEKTCDMKGKTERGIVFEKYLEFCKESKCCALPKKRFYEEIKERGILSGKTGNIRYFNVVLCDDVK